MISIEITKESRRTVERTLQNFMNHGKLAKAIIFATRRAAVTARKAGTQEIRKIYNVKAGTLKAAASLQTETMGTTIHIKGPEEPVTTYKATKQRKGIFVAIKKGSGSVVPRSFDMPGRGYSARRGAARYPVKKLFGPAIPQLFGNQAVVDVMTDKGMEMYEKRLMHELERMAGE